MEHRSDEDLKNKLSKSAESQWQVTIMEPQPVHDVDDLFVWPWFGVLVNVRAEWENGRLVGTSGKLLMSQLSRFYPQKVVPLWGKKGYTGNAIIEFARDWTGFKNANLFEAHFQAEGCGKRDWKERKYKESKMFGWFARADDYNSQGPIGAYLRKYGDLTTAAGHINDGARKARKLEANLASMVEVKDRNMQELERKYNGTTASIENMMAEREKLFRSQNEEMELLAENRKIVEENRNLSSELESKMKKLDLKILRSKQLDEQRRTHENLLKLVEEQKREKQAAQDKILESQQQMHDKHTLELEIKQLQGTLEVMKVMTGVEDSKRKIEELSKELQDKCVKMEKIESHQQFLLNEQVRSNDVLQTVRKELIKGLEDLTTGRTNISIKMMGALDPKSFLNACKQKLSKQDAEVLAATLISKWEAEMRNPEWHPFRVVTSIDARIPTFSSTKKIQKISGWTIFMNVTW